MAKKVIDEADTFKKRDDVVWRVINGEGVLLNLDNNFYYSLNDTGTMVYSLIEEGKSVSGILEAFKEKFAGSGYDFSEIRNDVMELLIDLLKEELIEKVTSVKVSSEEETE